jgi:hypothetical protein
LKFIWTGRWRKGDLSIEAQTLEELTNALNELGTVDELDNASSGNSYPEIPRMIGLTDAVRRLMWQDWGKQPRLMMEITKALKANKYHFPRGALSATLIALVKKGDVRRMKEEGKWKYFGKYTKD